jgi:hypothetical protein
MTSNHLASATGSHVGKLDLRVGTVPRVNDPAGWIEGRAAEANTRSCRSRGSCISIGDNWPRFQRKDQHMSNTDDELEAANQWWRDRLDPPPVAPPDLPPAARAPRNYVPREGNAVDKPERSAVDVFRDFLAEQMDHN